VEPEVNEKEKELIKHVIKEYNVKVLECSAKENFQVI